MILWCEPKCSHTHDNIHSLARCVLDRIARQLVRILICGETPTKLQLVESKNAQFVRQLGSSRGWTKTTCSRSSWCACLVRFGCAAKCDCSVQTWPNRARGGERTLEQFIQAKWGRCASPPKSWECQSKRRFTGRITSLVCRPDMSYDHIGRTRLDDLWSHWNPVETRWNDLRLFLYLQILYYKNKRGDSRRCPKSSVSKYEPNSSSTEAACSKKKTRLLPVKT